jgi:hypothetical protein
MKTCVAVLGMAVVPGLLLAQQPAAWSGYARDAQHTAQSTAKSQGLNKIHWSTPVDLNPPGGGGGPLYIHYGSPVVTVVGTVLVPVKTGATGGYQIQAFHGSSTPVYTLTSDYTSPAHNWIPPYGPALGLRDTVYYPGAGGTIYYREPTETPTGITGQIAFYGNALYNANAATFNSTVQICTPLTADRYGTIYFGFVVTGTNPAGLKSGIARITVAGAGTWMAVSSFNIGDSNISQIAMNAAPVLSVDQRTLYVVASSGNEFGYGYLVALNSSSLAPISHTELLDPRGGAATVSTDSSASPMVGPDGDVYFGVLEANCCSSHNDRGWMLHFNSTLSQTKTPGSFGWDNTASVVPSAAVPSYGGTSSYLILTKYNNYAGAGTGDGVNKVAVLDPNASMQDEYSSASVNVMKEVITIAGVTQDIRNGYPNAVREWCINTVAIDPFSKSALVNSEDGTLYRWDFTTNSFTESIRLTAGIGEAYTPTVIASDGTVYAINDATLYAVGN